MTLKEFGYCTHLSTGYCLGDMCESCVNERERMWDYRFWNLIWKLPQGWKLYRFWKSLTNPKEVRE